MISTILPFLLMVIVGVVIVIVTIIKATKKKSKNTPTVTPSPVAYAAPPAAPTEQDRLKAEIAALSLEEVHRRYCDVAGRSDEYRYLCYEELERRKGKQ